MDIMGAMDSGSLDHVSPKQRHYLMIYLWAVRNYHATKVSFNNVLTSKLFDNRAQEIMKSLDPCTTLEVLYVLEFE
jgi:hypothetical protein